MNKADLQVFIFRPLTPDELNELNDAKSTQRIVAIDPIFTEGIEVETNVLCSQELEPHESFARESIQNLGHIKLKSGSSLIDQTAFEGVVLWHPVRFGVYHKFKQLLIQQSVTEAFNQAFGGSVRIYTDQPLLRKLCSSAEIRFVRPSIRKSKTISPLKFGIYFLIRSFVGFVKNGIPAKGKRIVLNTVSPLSPLVSNDGIEITRGIPHIHYFLKRVQSNDAFALVSSMKFIGVKDGLFPLWETLRSSYPTSRVYHFESFVFTSLLSLNAVQKLYTYWRDLGRTELAGFSPVNQVLIEDFRKRRLQFVYAAVLTLGGFRLIKKMQPKCIGGDNEHNFVKRPIFGAAKKLHIPTFAVQHGDIHRNNFNYRFTQDDPIDQLLPDLTAVWGHQTKESLLQSSHYNADCIQIVGQVRTDVIPQLKKQDLNNRSDRTFAVLFASQPFFDPSLRKRMYQDFCIAAKALPNIAFIHKPHPSETDWSFFEEIDIESECKVRRSDQDLYMLLAQSDVVVTGFSTVGVEATYFHRDLIVLDYQKEDLAGYVKNMVALQATDGNQLTGFIQRLSEGEKLLDPTIRQKYIEQRVHAIDGKTSERLQTLIESL